MKKVAVVTGASGEIGRGIAIRLAGDGFVVAMSHLGEAGDANDLVAEIIGNGEMASAIKLDVADPFWARRFFEDIVKAFGSIDVIVVSNSEVLPLRRIREGGVLDEVVTTNLHDTFLILDEAARHVADGGKIIVVSNRAQAESHPTCDPHLASEARLEAHLYRLANEVHERGILVNLIARAPDQTGVSLENKCQEQVIYLDQHASSERPCTKQPADIAGIVSFLAGPDGYLMTSQVLCANDSAA